MQSISAVTWFPTLALICGLVLGALLCLGYACLMVVNARRLSGSSGLLVMAGALLFVTSIWQSRNVSAGDLQAMVADLQQQNRQLAKTLEEMSRQQQVRSSALSDHDIQLKVFHNILNQLQQKDRQQDAKIQEVDNKQEDAYKKAQNQLQNMRNSYSIKLEKQERLLHRAAAEAAQCKAEIAAISEARADHIEKSRLSFIKANTQRELSTLRREVKQLQTNLQYLQGRRRRTP